AHALVLQQMHQLAQLVFISCIGDGALEHRGNGAAGETLQTFFGRSEANAFEINIQRFAAARAEGSGLWRDGRAARIADRDAAEARERTLAHAAVGRESGGYEVIENGAQRGVSAPHDGCRAGFVRSGRHQRSAGVLLERTLIQANAEDAPAHTALQAAPAAPLIAV